MENGLFLKMKENERKAKETRKTNPGALMMYNMNSRRTEYKGYKRSDLKNDRKNF